MASSKGEGLATAVGFLAGLFACLDAVRDARVLWPPDTLWSALDHSRHLELGTGIALMAVMLVLSLRRAAAEP